ncbi:hypothetical protein A2U01_0098216, partial [Trifolium medium]|nr:hypothetical protein [Trifolium medium]
QQPLGINQLRRGPLTTVFIHERIPLAVFEKVGRERSHESHQLVIVGDLIGTQVRPPVGKILGLDKEMSFVPVKMEL